MNAPTPAFIDALTDAALAAVADGRLLDLVIAVLLLEIAALLAWHWRTGRGLAPRALLPNLLAGLCLMLGLRAVQAGGHGAWLVAALAASGLAHLVDMRQRWRG